MILAKRPTVPSAFGAVGRNSLEKTVRDRNNMVWLAAVSTLLLAASGQAQKPRISADQVIAANIASRGGMARIESVRTQKLRGHITFSGPVHPFAVDLARPGRIRTEITLDGGRIVQAYDGNTVWTINPVQQQNDTMPHVMPEGEARNVIAGGDMDGPLIHYAEKGNHVTYAGIDTADGRPAYKLEVVTAAGLADTYYIDTTSHLQTKWQGHRIMSGEPVVFESFFRDYRTVDGILIAFKVDSDTEGRAGGQHITLDTVQINAPVSDAEFAMPPKRPPTRPPTGP